MSIVIVFRGIFDRNVRFEGVKKIFPLGDGKVKLWLSDDKVLEFEGVYNILPA